MSSPIRSGQYGDLLNGGSPGRPLVLFVHGFPETRFAWEAGGPIAAIVAAALESPPQIAVELNLRIRNSAVTEFTMSARRHQLLSSNALPHLEAQSDAPLMTYA